MVSGMSGLPVIASHGLSESNGQLKLRTAKAGVEAVGTGRLQHDSWLCLPLAPSDPPSSKSLLPPSCRLPPISTSCSLNLLLVFLS